jgi:hypothetical protein
MFSPVSPEETLVFSSHIDYIIDNHPSTTTFPARAAERECFLTIHS